VAVTVTAVADAHQAAGAGADVLAVQGTEAGGHQGGFTDREANHRPLLSLLAEIRESTDLPLIGGGGIMTGQEKAAVLGAGALAVQLGTAFLCSTEAGTSPTHRQALLTRPLRAAATRVGDASVPNLWAGTGWAQVTSEPAGAIVRRIAAEAATVA